MRLPPFIFLIGPPKCGKTTLAALLCEKDSSIAHCSFDEPIREATLQIFFPEQLHLGIDLRDDDELNTALPFTNISIGHWMDSLRRTLTGISPTLIGDLAKKRLGYIQGGFQHFIFDDAESPMDIKPFALAYGQDHCKLIFIERAGKPIAGHLNKFGSTFISQLMIRNREENPQQMLEQLGQLQGIVNNLMPNEGEPPNAPKAESTEPRPSDL
jgi:hypothetical protein